MDNLELHEAINGLALQQTFLQRQKALLMRKRIAKRDAYDVLYSVLVHLYCIGDVNRFTALFERFIAAEMDFHFAQIHDLWYFVECSILHYSDLTGDSSHDQRIRDKGFVASRLEGTMLDLNSRNLAAELGELEKGHPLPQETILRRYRSLMAECLLIIRFKKTGLFGSHRGTKAKLQHYRQLYLAAEEQFGRSDEEFIAGLRRISTDIV